MLINQINGIMLHYGHIIIISMNFAGLVSQDGMSGQLTADAAYASFRNELSKDTRTAQSGFGYPTVLGY